MASSSSSTTVEVRKHDVFLCFCGVDTRYTFTSTLQGLLKREGINVFIDYELKRGDNLSSLMNAIEESMISVIIFSKTFACSRWCLEELVKILECKNMQKQVVIPVFYRIDPSDVRNQTGPFGEGFAKLVKSFNKERLEKLQITEGQFIDKIHKWKNALTEAANLSGWTSEQEPFDYNLVNKVIEDIWKKLNIMIPTNDSKNLVGVEPIIHRIEYLLQIGSRNVHVIGIWGMRGIGKTTIANSIFKKISSCFEGSYFAKNIREASMSPNGLNPMRQELLSTILKHPDFVINSKFAKGMLARKQVLIVFDDVTTLSQVEYLIEDINCLGSGSRIIITTTDKQVLRNCGVDENSIYKMNGLLMHEAHQLFRWYAFRENGPNQDYDDLSNRVVNYAKGVPLALKVLGCYLLGKSKQVWESAINKLEIIPHQDIHNVLKVCYEGLNDDEQNMFLDIACFLKWENKDFVMDFLYACDFEAEIGLSVLIDKCLITISKDYKITMHDLLQEMGWEIVRQESKRHPGKRSRLWYHKDIYNVLKENEISNAIEGMCFDMSKQGEIIYLQPSALGVMDQLRFFKLHNVPYEENNINKVHVSNGLNSVSTKVRYLCWHGCPLKSLQSNFLSKNLVALDMPYSNIEQLWSSAQLDNLKHIDLSYSKHLRIQDLSLAPNLEILILEGCTNLYEISSSIRGLNYKLFILNLRHCKSLDNLPTGIHMKSLKKVIFSGCSNLKEFPQISWNMNELYLDETAIEELPTSIESLSRLVILNLKDCSMLERLPSNICELKSLEHLNLSGCSKLHGFPDSLGNLEALRVLKAETVATREVPTSILNLHCLEELDLTNCGIEELPDNLGQLSSLKSLALGRNFFESIPASIADLSKLSYLDLSYCDRLQMLPELPSKLENIDAYNCTAFEKSSSLLILFARDFPQSIRVNFSNCFELDQNACSEAVKQFQKLMSIGIPLLGRRISPQTGSGSICLPGSEIPEWLVFQRIGSFITLDQQANLRSSDLNSFFVCVVEFRNYHNEGQGLVVGFECLLTREDGIVDVFLGTLRGWDYGTGPDYVDSDHVFLGYDFALKFSGLHNIEDHKYDEMTIRFYVENLFTETLGCCNVKKCGVWGPKLELKTREEKPESKKLKIENSYGGESGSRIYFADKKPKIEIPMKDYGYGKG